MIGIILALIGGAFAIGNAAKKSYRNNKYKSYHSSYDAYTYPYRSGYFDANTGHALRIIRDHPDYPGDTIAYDVITGEKRNVSERCRMIAFERARNDPGFKGTTLKWGRCKLNENNWETPIRGDIYKDLKTGNFYIPVKLKQKAFPYKAPYYAARGVYYYDYKNKKVVRPTDSGLVENDKQKKEYINKYGDEWGIIIDKLNEEAIAKINSLPTLEEQANYLRVPFNEEFYNENIMTDAMWRDDGLTREQAVKELRRRIKSFY